MCVCIFMQYYKIIAYAILIYYFAISRNYHPISFRLFLEHVFCKVDWTSFLIFVFNVGILIGKKALVSELTSWNWIFLILEHENSNSSKRDSRKIVTYENTMNIYISSWTRNEKWLLHRSRSLLAKRRLQHLRAFLSPPVYTNVPHYLPRRREHAFVIRSTNS